MYRKNKSNDNGICLQVKRSIKSTKMHKIDVGLLLGKEKRKTILVNDIFKNFKTFFKKCIPLFNFNRVLY